MREILTVEMTIAYLVALIIIVFVFIIAYFYISNRFVKEFTFCAIIRGDKLVFLEPLKVELGLIEVQYSVYRYLLTSSPP